ncbi:MAG TPA: hypothetical protein ENK18_26120 [Deltaproteobacteria bacterium]|nr:hypothetical protein [Deltaproteobacteria bacterium]
MLRWSALIGACALPFIMSGLGIAIHQRTQDRRSGSTLPLAAGPWLEARIQELGLSVDVEVHPRDGLDAYWPSVGAIGLSERTWGGCRPGQWTIAAHELGHALNMASSPLIAELLPMARLAQGQLWRAFAAALLCSALLQEPALLPLALALLLGSATVTAVVCLDEASASRHGYRMLREDERMSEADLELARRSMLGAGTIYGLGLVGQLAVLACWGPLASWVSAAPPADPGPIGAGVLWLTLALIPILVLRAAHVLLQVMSPEPVTTDFRLFTVMHREGQWEFLTGMGVLILVMSLHPLIVSPLGALALVLGTMTAIGPVGGLGRALILFPLLLLVHRWLERPEEEDDAFFPPATLPDESAPALMALYTDPPWYLRVSWLAHLAYLPLLGLLIFRLLA